jgi:hypothetical protein
VTLPTLLLIASPDSFLLELERRECEDAWRSTHRDGEVTSFDAAPTPDQLVRELASPSLFATDRLLLVRDASAYFGDKSATSSAGEALAQALGSLPLTGVTLVLALVAAAQPQGTLAEVSRRRGEARYFPVPPAPKPWETVRITADQRAVLKDKVLARVAPSLLADREVVDALCEAYGFRPRELAAAAQRLLLSGRISAATVREQTGAPEGSPRQLEAALLDRDLAGCARLFSALEAGGTLLSWWGEPVPSERQGAFLAQAVGRLLRQALAARTHAVQAGLARELDPRRCAESNWYPKTFRARLHKPMQANIDATPHSPLGGMSAWQLHRAFRLGSAYGEGALLAALGRLAASGAERSRTAAARVAVSSVMLGLIANPGV